MKRIERLRQLMSSHEVNAYIIPSTDEWRNEYTPFHTKRLEWICGFSGSNGVLIITQHDLILFTDSRYIAQAKVELNDHFTVVDMHKESAYDVMKACKGGIVGYDPMIQTLKELEHYEALGKKFGFSMQAIDENLVDLLMHGNTIEIEELSGDVASKLCRDITKKLPEYFGKQQANELYTKNVRNCISFGAKANGKYVGLISISFQYKKNANVYWIGVLPSFHRQGVGNALINSAAKFISQSSIKTMTVDTVSPSEGCNHYLQTYNFYLAQGFTPLFDIQPQGYDQKMVYMIKNNLSDSKKSHNSQIQNFPLEVAGMAVNVKIDSVIKKLPTECDCLILTSPASICWLLNIRGNDIPYNPLVLCYAILDIKTRKVQLFANTNESVKIDYEPTECYSLNAFKTHIKQTQVNNLRLAFDKEDSSVWLSKNTLKSVHVKDPTVILRAVKNSIELEGFKRSHVYDGVALCKFWFWLYKSIQNGSKIDEISAAEKLSEFRGTNAEFVEESFYVISGYGSNGAIVHYRPQPNTCKSIPTEGEDPIYLVDSGAHYSCAGTTDITRVFNIGKFVDGVTAEHKRIYTAILKGHIAIANAAFPVGTNGSQLDALARYHLWQQGLDYGHGTGHGVGYFSSVHEGPQGITKNNTETLKENMIISIEPGYYREGAFGMRIENLYAVKKSSKFKGFLEFDSFTMVPIETSLIDFHQMNKDEVEWLTNHNKIAVEAVKDGLTKEELEFIISNSFIQQ